MYSEYQDLVIWGIGKYIVCGKFAVLHYTLETVLLRSEITDNFILHYCFVAINVKPIEVFFTLLLLALEVLGIYLRSLVSCPIWLFSDFNSKLKLQLIFCCKLCDIEMSQAPLLDLVEGVLIY